MLRMQCAESASQMAMPSFTETAFPGAVFQLFLLELTFRLRRASYNQFVQTPDWPVPFESRIPDRQRRRRLSSCHFVTVRLLRVRRNDLVDHLLMTDVSEICCGFSPLVDCRESSFFSKQISKSCLAAFERALRSPARSAALQFRQKVTGDCSSSRPSVFRRPRSSLRRDKIGDTLGLFADLAATSNRFSQRT